jgi:hypothetical protein
MTSTVAFDHKERRSGWDLNDAVFPSIVTDSSDGKGGTHKAG